MSASDQPVVIAALLPHAPILIPELGGARGRAAKASTEAMREVARRIVAAAPEALVLISPHTPRRRGAFALWSDSRVQGSLAAFGAPQVAVNFPADETWATALRETAGRAGLQLWRLTGDELDHGAVVPLWFLAEAGWTGPTLVLGLNYPGEPGVPEMGRALAAAARAAGRQRVAFVASGDMSHRLQPGAPAGYDPRAREFDAAFIGVLRGGDYRALDSLDAELQERAAEDAVDSTRMAVAAVNGANTRHEVRSYEGPFGVGYGVAILFARTGGEADGAAAERQLPAVARRSLEAAFANPDAEAPRSATAGVKAGRPGVFVTLRTRSGELRGCVGTLTGRYEDVAAETWHMARAAAFRDSRFEPLRAEELADLRIEVSVLQAPEPVRSAAELDPAHFGVIVSAADGRRGVLLPDIEGVNTVDEQLAIARRKAGIRADEPVTLERFAVRKFVE